MFAVLNNKIFRLIADTSGQLFAETELQNSVLGESDIEKRQKRPLWELPSVKLIDDSND